MNRLTEFFRRHYVAFMVANAVFAVMSLLQGNFGLALLNGSAFVFMYTTRNIGRDES